MRPSEPYFLSRYDFTASGVISTVAEPARLRQRLVPDHVAHSSCLDCLELAVGDLEQPGEGHEASANLDRKGGDSFVLNVVLDLGPSVLEDCAHLDLRSESRRTVRTREARNGSASTSPGSGMLW